MGKLKHQSNEYNSTDMHEVKMPSFPQGKYFLTLISSWWISSYEEYECQEASDYEYAYKTSLIPRQNNSLVS